MTSASKVLPSPSEERIDLPIRGMSCAACAARIQKTLTHLAGVRSANVNFATNRATIVFEPAAITIQKIQAAVTDTGYEAGDPVGDSTAPRDGSDAIDYQKLRSRFLIAAVLTLPVLVIAMSHGTISFLRGSWVNYVELALTTPVVAYAGIRSSAAHGPRCAIAPPT